MVSHTPPIIVFDLDGTLAHTAPDLLDSLNHALLQMKLSPIEPQAISFLVGQGARLMIERALISQNVALEEPLIAAVLANFLEHYHDNIPGQTRYFEGVDEALDALQAQDFLLAVCTNKSQKLASRLLSFLEKKHRFSAICGGDRFEWRKPDPRHITATIAQAGGNPTCAIMVGDSRADIEAAKAANIPVIGVDFGYSDVSMQMLGADYVVSDFVGFADTCQMILR